MEKEQKTINKDDLKLHDVQGSPFIIVEQNLEYKIIIGNDLASEKTFKNIKEAKKYIYSKPWELIGVLAVKILKSQYEYRKEDIQEAQNAAESYN